MTDFQRNLAIVIGINQYQNGIKTLTTAVADAQEMARILEEIYHYTLVHPNLAKPSAILDADATLQQLRQLFTETLPNQIKLTSQDRLLIYFAGHGITRKSSDQGPQGFLVPQDADGQHPDSMLPMRELYECLNKLECRHLLVILDCCFAGMFRWASTRKVVVVPETIHWEHYYRFIKYPAWQVITSAAHNQEALDYLDNRGTGSSGKHSPFAEALFEGLLEQKADLIPDGVITAPELYLYLRDYVEKNSKERQTPGFWPLMKHDRGEYIFQLVSKEQLKLKDAPKLEKDNNPYRGLESFEERHARFFFGRQEVIDELITHISKPGQQFTVVDGISGSGKSSLVKAGLLPKLRQSQRKTWQTLKVIRPGADPYVALANAACPPGTKLEKLRQVGKKIKAAPEQFYKLVNDWAKQYPNKKLLLVIDQFEELITLEPRIAQNNQEQKRGWLSFLKGKKRPKQDAIQSLQQLDSKPRWQAFTELLSDALKACPQLHLIVTLRSDFSPRFQESALHADWAKARFIVRPMRSDELREAVLGPANEMALYFEPANLVDRLVDEVVQMPGVLPLLSFTLSELYLKLYEAWSQEGKGNRALSVDEDFDAQGGVAGLLARRANAEYDQLPDNAHRVTMQRVILRMVELEGTEAVKRRIPRTELVYPGEAENKRVETVLQRLDQTRLIVGGDEAGEAYVEPAHDFFVRGWDRLQDWIRDEQEILALQRLLNPAAKNWNKTKSDLWNANSRLEQLSEIRKSNQSWLNQLESKFIEQSFNLRCRNRNYLRIFVSLAFLGLASVTAITMLQNLNNQIKLSSTASLEKYEAREEIEALLQVLEIGSNVQKLHQWPFVITPSTQLKVTDELQKILYGISEVNRFPSMSYPIEANFSLNGEYIVAAYDGGTIKVLSSTEGEKYTPISLSYSVSDSGYRRISPSIAVSNSGKKIAIGENDGNVRVLDSHGSILKEFIINQPVNEIIFGPDETEILIKTSCTIYMISITSGLRQEIEGCWFDIGFDNQQIVAIARNGNINIFDWVGKIYNNWDTEASLDRFWKKPIDISPDGEKIAIANGSNVDFWNKSGQLLGTTGLDSRVASNIQYISNSLFVVAEQSGFVNIWHISHNEDYFSATRRAQWPKINANISDIITTPNQGQIILLHDNSQRARDPFTASIWDWEKQQTIVLENSIVTNAFNHNRKKLITSRLDSAFHTGRSDSNVDLRLWDVSRRQNTRFSGSQVAFSRNREVFAVGYGSGDVELFNDIEKESTTLTAQEWVGATCREGCITHMDFSPDSQYFLTAGGTSSGRLWNLSGEVIWDNFAEIGYVRDVQFSSEDNIFAIAADGSGAAGSEVQILKIDGLGVDEPVVKELSTVDIIDVGNIDNISFIPNSSKLLIVSSGDVFIYDYSSEQVNNFPHPNYVDKAIASPDGQTVVTASFDRQIRLHNLDGSIEETFPQQSGRISNIAFSPDGSILAFSSSDGLIKFWDPKGDEIYSFQGPGDWQDAYFTQDLKTIAFTQELQAGDQIILWSLDLGLLLDDACDWLSDYLDSNSSVSEREKLLCKDPKLIDLNQES